MTIPVDAYARPRTGRRAPMPFDADQAIQQLQAQRMLEQENRMPGAEERIRQLQRMRQQQPRQVAPDPQPPPPPGPLKSVLIRPDQMM